MNRFYFLSLALIGGISLANADDITSDYTYTSYCKGSPWDFDRPVEAVSQSPKSNISKVYAKPYESAEPAFELYYNNGYLEIKWYNIESDCGTSNITTEVKKISDNHLRIYLKDEDPDAPKADCICLYDASSYLSGIEPGEYTLTLYGTDFNVNLQNGYHELLLINTKYRDENTVSRGVKQSTCRSFSYTAYEEDPYQFTPRYEVEYADGHLFVTWKNVSENCAAIFRHADMIREGNTLTFNHYTVFPSELMTCMCLFDVTADFEGIEPDHYKLKFYGNEYDLDLTANTSEVLLTNGEISGIDFTLEENNMLSFGQDKILKVQAQNAYTLDVYNVDGIRIATLSGNGSDEIDLNTLPKGVYLVNLTTDGQTQSRRIII